MTKNNDIIVELQIIEIIDELIHSITRRHIPDYPEATIAINKLKHLNGGNKDEWSG